MTRNPLPLWLAIVFIVAALALPVLPFWLAIAAVIAFCAWATFEVVTFRRRAHRIDAARELFRREVERMPARPEPTRRQVLMHTAQFPAAWQPFVAGRPEFQQHADWPRAGRANAR